MSVPGIGVLSAPAYVSTVEDPGRFGRSRSVRAHLGLTPRQYRSGEVDRSGRISRCGDTLARTLLYEAAVVILSRVKRASRLKDWARAIAKRSGNGKARVALARKLSVILHSVWRSGQPFRWSEHASAKELNRSRGSALAPAGGCHRGKCGNGAGASCLKIEGLATSLQTGVSHGPRNASPHFAGA